MSGQSQTTLSRLYTQIDSLPLWVKHVIYVQLTRELETTISRRTLDAFGYGDMLQLFVPLITHAGRRELEQPSDTVPKAVYQLLHMVSREKNVVDTCILNNWNLEDCSRYLLLAIEKELILPPGSNIVMATIEFLAGQSRIGDYLVKIGRLNLRQLDQALRTQRYIEESMGERTGIANVLINLGYINKEDTEGLLMLKQESKKICPPIDHGAVQSAPRS
jgi:hypothetical protein